MVSRLRGNDGEAVRERRRASLPGDAPRVGEAALCLPGYAPGVLEPVRNVFEAVKRGFVETKRGFVDAKRENGDAMRGKAVSRRGDSDAHGLIVQGGDVSIPVIPSAIPTKNPFSPAKRKAPLRHPRTGGNPSPSLPSEGLQTNMERTAFAAAQPYFVAYRDCRTTRARPPSSSLAAVIRKRLQFALNVLAPGLQEALVEISSTM